MIKVRCPICQRLLEGEGPKEWPEFPFCSPRCRLIDLGRWLGEEYGYRVAAPDGEESLGQNEENIPP
jgi:endogenous inhibitor of DNA gyrase (YacG/DUF329 family)